MAPAVCLHNIYSKIASGLPPVASSEECPVKNRHLAKAARVAVTQARKRGSLVPASACSQCGSVGRMHAHHDDYAEPLAVRWLCCRCHRRYHTSLARIFPELKARRAPLPRSAGTPIFNTSDRSTWPMVLSIAQVSELYGRTVRAIRSASDQGRFVPAAFLSRPYRWRKADVLRHLEGARGTSLRAVR